MRILFWLFTICISINAFAVDLTISPTVNSPVSGCNLSSAETVQITIVNADVAPYSGTFDVSFTINSTTVTESITIVFLPISGTFIYTFISQIDLSGCGMHNIDLNVNDPSDVNTSNNTISISITNDCTPTSGSLNAPASVCVAGNSGQLELLGNTGVITDWKYSENNGNTFTSTSNTSSIEPFTNLIIERIYRVYFDSQYGICPSDSLSDTILIDAISNAGTLSKDSTHCDTILPTTLFLNGYNGMVVNYQLSLNGGASYSTFTNPFDTLEYTEFGNNFQFFAITQNGTCPADSSNIVNISLQDNPFAGEIVGEDTICLGVSSTDLSLNNHVGTILDWEYSDNNGVSWQSTGFNSTNVTLTNLSTSLKIRAVVENIPCGTDTAFFDIDVIPNSNSGILTGNALFCSTTNNGFISTTVINGTVIEWIESINNGQNFNPVNNTNDTLNYNDINSTTIFAVIVKNENCPADTSNFVTITIDEASEAGNIMIADSLCPILEGTEAVLTNYNGSILDWRYSTNAGASWMSSGVTDSIYIQTDLYGDISYQVIVKNGNCPEDTITKDIFIFGPLMEGLVNEDTITLGDSITLIAPDGDTYEWLPNLGISDPNASNPKAAPLSNTEYEVTVTDTNGCQTISFHTIIIGDDPVVISSNNFISPNGDGINDTWQIKNINLFPQNSVYVFDSYGQMIFTESPYNNDWDVNAANLPDGTYFYSITVEPDSTPYKGTITIINN